MLNIEYVTGIKLNWSFEPLERLDNIIVLSPNTYFDAITKLGRIYMSIKEKEYTPDVEIDASLENNADFFPTLKGVIDMIAAGLSIYLEGDNYKAKFIDLLNKANSMGTILFNFDGYNLIRLDEGDARIGIKITDESGGVVYSFEQRDRDDFGRMRSRHE